MTKADIVETVYEKVGGFSRRRRRRSSRRCSTHQGDLGEGRRRSRSPASELRRAGQERPGWPQPPDWEEITISARRVLTFKPSQVLKNALNG
jgi:integration host factor subunit alpha